MAADGKGEQLRLGFLTAIEVAEKGFVGGLLVTNHYGRPLEFQCTSPVKPNSTQEILYGAALVPYLLGELIGATLVAKASIAPQIILTDREPILELRHHVEQPVGLVDEAEPGSSAEAPGELKIGCRKVRFHPAHAGDSGAVSARVGPIPADADLREPLQRVREALQETLRSGALR